jgi:hypothetical protein
MVTSRIYVELSPDIQEWMADNGVSIQDILKKENIDADVEAGVSPFSDESGARTKDVLPMILVNAASISTVLFAISHCLKTWLDRPIYSIYEEAEEIRDKDGNVLLDEQGAPQMKTVRKHVVLQPGKSDKKANAEVAFGPFVAKFSTEEKKLPE